MMFRRFKNILTALSLIGAATVCGAPPPRGEWRCVALTPRHLALTGDYSQLQRELSQKRLAERVKMSEKTYRGWMKELRFYLAGIDAVAAYLPVVVGMLRDNPKIGLHSECGAIAVLGTGYWLNPIGQALFTDTDGKERFANSADIAHYLFLKLDRPLADGEKLTITMPAGEKIVFTYRKTAPTPIFKINQVGYMPNARKFAYLGAWCGTAGALPLFGEFTGKPFRLIDIADGRTVFTGQLTRRPPDPILPSGTPSTGEETLEMDISDFTRTGKYCLEVDGIGRSETFRINDDTMAEAFYVHARGLYHQRCGIAKEKPYTNWVMPACHQKCIRGTFPPDINHYGKGKKEDRPYGFRDENGKLIGIRHFKLIAQNRPEKPEVLNVFGGWHDAADWDRRPQHLSIVGDLTAVYLLKPENFSDGQLNIPESGNGIPDILDEACWGIEHLRLKQQSDGGVGTWTEARIHPGLGRSADDPLNYYLSCATRGSTLEYAAYASELALALKHAGATKRAELYHDSARRAWEFAIDPKNRVVRNYKLNNKIVSYCEPPELDRCFLLKTGFNLFQLSGDERYLFAIEPHCVGASKHLHKDLGGKSPLFLVELEVFPCPSVEVNKLRGKYRRIITDQARIMLRQQENNYPIRVPWKGINEAWFHAMSWGNYHPLRQALTLIAAHALTGGQEFLDGAYLANDFHNGANPSGSSMTSGLGKVYPVRFLHIDSYTDGIAEFVPGITPYRNTFGIPRPAIRMAFGLYYRSYPFQNFEGLSLSLLPKEGLSEEECNKEICRIYPFWRRWCNIEGLTVATSEFTVFETIGPAVAVSGYLLNGAQAPAPEWKNRIPADDIRKLPGYAPLP